MVLFVVVVAGFAVADVVSVSVETDVVWYTVVIADDVESVVEVLLGRKGDVVELVCVVDAAVVVVVDGNGGSGFCMDVCIYVYMY